MALTNKMIADFKAAWPTARSAHAAAIAAGWSRDKAARHSSVIAAALGLAPKTGGAGKGKDPAVTAFAEYVAAYPCSDENERVRLCTAVATRLRKAQSKGGAS